MITASVSIRAWPTLQVYTYLYVDLYQTDFIRTVNTDSWLYITEQSFIITVVSWEEQLQVVRERLVKEVLSLYQRFADGGVFVLHQKEMPADLMSVPL